MNQKTSHTKPPRGTIYNNNGRYYWRVRFPDEDKRRAIPLKSAGSDWATTHYDVACEIAKGLWEDHVNQSSTGITVKTVHGLCNLYRKHIVEYYAGSTEICNIGYAVAYLEKQCPDLPVDQFDSLKLMEIREVMIEDGSSRSTVNRRISMIKRMFRWGVANRHCSPYIFKTLEAVEGLKKGRSRARETEKVEPVAQKDLEEVLPHLSDVVASMVRLQLITGMRSTELCMMRLCDIDRSEDVWIYRPSIFKGQHREGYTRIVALGKQAQDILSPYLLNKKPTSTEYLFKPEDGDQSTKHRDYNPHYTKDSYGRAVRRKIEIVNRNIKKNCLNDAECKNRMIDPWTPNQLRHAFATTARKREGTETARASMGHTKLQTLDVYAKSDRQLAVDYARKYG